MAVDQLPGASSPLTNIPAPKSNDKGLNMRFGANTFIFSSPFSTDHHLGLVKKLKDMGLDLIEVAVEDPALVDVEVLKKALEEHDMGAVVCGAFGPDRNISSLDPEIRANAKEYLYWLIDAAETLGSKNVIGPMYSAVGKPRLEDPEERKIEWGLAVKGLKEACQYAQEKGVSLAFEPLNRFETDLINIVEQGLTLIEEVGEPNIGLHLDTFHMHLEEKDSAAAVRMVGDRVFHVHACENDRGVPGTGQVNWRSVFEALAEIGYDGDIVIESFTPEVKSIARAVCIWREIAPSQDAIVQEGTAFLKTLVAK
jgi:D-psicose/D-tagatose/L-ribulose 3-epimerase